MCSPILAGVTQTSLFRPSSVRVPPLGCPPEVDLPLCGIVIFSRQSESLPHLPRLRGRAWAPAPRSSVSVSDFAREALHTPACAFPVSCKIGCFGTRHMETVRSSIRASSPFSPLHRITLDCRRGVDFVLTRTIILGLMWGVERSGVAASSERSEGPM